MSSTEIAPISELSNAELDEVGGGFLRFNRNQIVVANQQNIATVVGLNIGVGEDVEQALRQTVRQANTILQVSED